MLNTPFESFHLSLQVQISFSTYGLHKPTDLEFFWFDCTYCSREFLLVITSSDTFLCYISANTSSEKDSNSNSVTQNEPAVQEDSNSVKQNKSNSTDIEHDWSKDIEKVQFFLKKELLLLFWPFFNKKIQQILPAI